MPLTSLDVPDLYDALGRLLMQVPVGRVTTYGALARALGDVVAARWVGHWMLHHDHGPLCTCHRVVRVSGELGRYIRGGVDEKARRLAAESALMEGPMVDLDRRGFDAFETDYPLQRLARLQESLRSRVSLRGRRGVPELVGGVDVSYASPTEAVAAFALVEVASGQLLWHHVVRRAVSFPYISSYLSFRELPILLELLEEIDAAGRGTELLLVDGSGVLHPRGAGIASHLGILADVATIGITKSHLCGKIVSTDDEAHDMSRVIHDGRRRGVAICPTQRSSKRLFVSPGHRIGLPAAVRVVQKLLCGHKLPEPIYWSDRLSRAAAR